MIDYQKARTAMVDCQIRPSDVTQYPIIKAFLSVPREKFVEHDQREIAYAGIDLLLANHRSLLDPRVFAKMLNLANIQDTNLVLDVGCGFGYSTAIIAEMAQMVIGVENDAQMVKDANERLLDADIDNAMVVQSELTEGNMKHGPYDVIIIEGMVEKISNALLGQLKTGGKILTIFSVDGASYCAIGIKNETGITWRRGFDAKVSMLNGFRKEAHFEL